MTMKYLFYIALSFFLTTEVYCSDLSFVMTGAGKVEITKLADNKSCELKIKNRVIHQYDCEFSYLPTIIEHFKGNFSPFTEILVIQEWPMGNACNGGAIRFLGIKKKGTYILSKEIGFCGGPDPIVGQSRGKVLLIFPGSPPNRGDGNISTEVWIFENGKTIQLNYIAWRDIFYLVERNVCPVFNHVWIPSINNLPINFLVVSKRIF